MRAVGLSLVALLGGCAPDIVPGAYFCGPEKSCPEDQRCSELDNMCVLPGLVEEFACSPDVASEPDDAIEQGYVIPLDCPSLPVVIDSCMPSGDPSDWAKLTPPAQCSAIEIDARISFPVAFQRLAIEIVDEATSATVGTGGDCPVTPTENGDDIRCLRASLTPGKTYGLKVSPTGEGDCDGDCAFNRYTLRIQLAAPD